jgi:hypothetical protein
LDRPVIPAPAAAPDAPVIELHPTGNGSHASQDTEPAGTGAPQRVDTGA